MSSGRFKSRRCLKVELQKQLLDVFVQVRQSDSSFHQAMAHLVRKFFLEGVIVVVRARLHHHHFVRTDNSDVNQSKSNRARPASALPLRRVATHKLVQIVNTSLCFVVSEHHFWLAWLPPCFGCFSGVLHVCIDESTRTEQNRTRNRTGRRYLSQYEQRVMFSVS